MIAPPVCLLLGFVYVGGGLSPHRLTPSRFVDAFEHLPGSYPGYRRNHAKGICIRGHFDSSGAAAPWIAAPLFREQGVPVIGRLSMPGGNPIVADRQVPVRSMALEFESRAGGQWRTAMNSVPVFAVRTPQAMMQRLQAMRVDPHTGHPDPARVRQFYASHPQTRPFTRWLARHPPSSSYANGTYYSINAFRITGPAGGVHAVRWRMVPLLPYAPMTAAERGDDDALAHDLQRRLAQAPLRWRLVFKVAAPGDPTDDATAQWPAARTEFDAGTLVVDRATPQIQGACRDVSFDPLVLPRGMAPSDDPLLILRDAAYTESYARRIGEEAARTDTLE